jgi:selenophosphate synthetase-related protein
VCVRALTQTNAWGAGSGAATVPANAPRGAMGGTPVVAHDLAAAEDPDDAAAAKARHEGTAAAAAPLTTRIDEVRRPLLSS